MLKSRSVPILTQEEIDSLLKVCSEEDNSQKSKQEPSKYIFVFGVGNCYEGVDIVGTFYGTFFELKLLLETPPLQNNFFKKIIDEGCGSIDIFRNNFNCFERGKADHSIFFNRAKAFENLCQGTEIEISNIVIDEISKYNFEIIKEAKDWLDYYTIKKN